MKGIAKVTLKGNIGSIEDAARFTKKGRSIMVFTMAVNKDYGDVKRVNWYRINVLDATPETLPFKKGAAVEVVGDLTVADYVSKEGIAKYSLDVLTSVNDVREVVFEQQEEVPF